FRSSIAALPCRRHSRTDGTPGLDHGRNAPGRGGLPGSLCDRATRPIESFRCVAAAYRHPVVAAARVGTGFAYRERAGCGLALDLGGRWNWLGRRLMPLVRGGMGTVTKRMGPRAGLERASGKLGGGIGDTDCGPGRARSAFRRPYQLLE